MDVVFHTADAVREGIGPEDAPLLVMPFVDGRLARRSATQLAGRAGVKGQIVCVYDEHRTGFIAVANAVFRCSRSPQFGYVAQDAFAGRNWLALAQAGLAKREGGLLGFNDGKWAGRLAAFGLVRREWARENYGGDLFHPDYKSHYADVELTLLAMQQLKYRFEPLAVLVEVDWKKEEAQVSATDRLLYYKRAQGHFDGRVTNPGLRRMFK